MKKVPKAEKKYSDLKGFLLFMGFVVALMLSPWIMNVIDELKTNSLVAREMSKQPAVRKWSIHGYADGDPLSQGFQLTSYFENEPTVFLSFWSITPKDFTESTEINLTGIGYYNKKFSPFILDTSGQWSTCGSSSALNLLSPPVKEFLEISEVNNIHGLIENREKIRNKLSQVPVVEEKKVDLTGGMFLRNYCPGNDVFLYFVEIL